MVTRYVGYEVTLDDIQLGYERMQGIARRHAAIGSLTVLNNQVVVPNQKVRARSTELLREFGSQLTCAVAIEGTNLVSVTKRTVAATVFLLARAPRAKVFADPEDGAQWLVGRLGQKGPPVIKLLEVLRSPTANS